MLIYERTYNERVRRYLNPPFKSTGLMTYYERCLCEIVYTPAKGSYDAVTKEWLPDKETMHITLIPKKECPRHGKLREDSNSDQ